LRHKINYFNNGKSKRNSNLKAVVLVLALCLIASLAYIFKLSSDAKVAQTKIVTVTDEKGKVMDELAALKTTYDEAIAQNTSMSNDLIAERDKVVKLMVEVKKSTGNVNQYKQKFLSLQTKMKEMMKQVDDLKNKIKR